ncbi:MAG: hypothetical protein IPM79_10630 [Polyangiaceae bacterium]|nr:hypothetical protein [Polyangiaceae bacterium]MBK8938075.1 hypothetical protein [Polyangiaceae bacterium]
MSHRWVVAAIASAALGGGASVALVGALAPNDARAEAPKEGWPPDPAPVAATKQWVFEMRAKDSVPSVAKVSALELSKAEATPRMMGRWALELYVGTELLDRLRFNVPLAGDTGHEKKEAGKNRPVFKVNTKFFVRLADHPRATQLRLVDRATGDIQTFAWPPDKDGKLVVWTSPSSPADAGAADSASDAAGSSDAGKFTPDAI